MKEKMNNHHHLYHLTVPTFFKCPISMDLMKSPVILSTGVTYDRTSIQKWLDSGHNTCPATMQVLNSTDVVPNLTLRRLIRLWFDPSESHLTFFSNHLAVEYVGRLISRDEEEAEGNLIPSGALSRIVELAKLSEEGRESLANLDGFVPMMARILKKSSGGDDDDDQVVEVVELVITALDLIRSVKGVNERLKRSNLDDAFFSPFDFVLRKGGLDSRIRAARVLESIAVFDNESRRAIADQKGLLNEIYRLTNTLADQTAIDAGLSALIAISTSKPVKMELIRLGIVRTAVRILFDSGNTVGVVEKAMKVLQMMSTCREGRTAISEDDECVSGVVRRLMKVSPAATESGIGMLWSVCYMWRDRSCQVAAMESNGLTKVLLVMQSNISGGIRQMCGDLVKVFRRVDANSCLASYETQTTHIMPY